MIWDIVQQKLEAAGLAQGGVDFFIQRMPADVRRGVMVRSPLTGIKVDPNLPKFYKPDLQVILRHTDPVAGLAQALKIQKVLTVETEESYAATVDRGAILLKIFHPRELPIEFPNLEGNAIEWSLNFRTAWTLQD